MDPQREERRLTTILAADVVGYSRLMAVDESGTLAQLKAGRKELIEPLTAEYHGRVVKLMGDGTLMEFGSVVDAVNFAVDVQQAMAHRNEGVPEDRRITYRVGINIGDIIVDGDDIYGDGVNIAARLEALAEPGGICISRPVHTQIRGKLDFAFEDLGEQRVKNIPEPVRVFRVMSEPGPAAVAASPARPTARSRRWLLLAAGLAVLAAAGLAVSWLQPWQRAVEPASPERMAYPLPDKPSIAVLPFTNMSDDPSQDYFADGIAEDLITDLSKVSGLFVIARNSVFTYKGKPVKVRQVAEELGVRYVLEGSVRRSGDQVRINAQLIDASTGGHLWADRYDGSLEDVFGLQDKVTRKIVAVLAVQLTTGEQERVALKDTDNAAAYDAFLQGWQHYLRQRPDDFRIAISHFEKAVELDPRYARAYAALAATYWRSYENFWQESVGLATWHDARFRAEELLQEAMRNPTPLAHQVAADMFLHGRQHEAAIDAAERAIALDPNDADSYVALASALSLAGRPEEARRYVERAMRLNPHYPPFYLFEFGLAQFGMAELEKAAETLEKATALNPEDRSALRLLLATYGLLGRNGAAERVFRILSEAGGHGGTRAYLDFMDPLTVRASAFWHPFKVAADAERFAEGLRRAGVSD